MDERIVKVAMNMILHAGDARENIHQALKSIRENKLEETRIQMEEADKNLILAHKFQTEIIQSACGGEEIEYNILFAHAMDTLMTVQSEYEISRDLALIFESLEERLKGYK